MSRIRTVSEAKELAELVLQLKDLDIMSKSEEDITTFIEELDNASKIISTQADVVKLKSDTETIFKHNEKRTKELSLKETDLKDRYTQQIKDLEELKTQQGEVANLIKETQSLRDTLFKNNKDVEIKVNTLKASQDILDKTISDNQEKNAKLDSQIEEYQRKLATLSTI